MTPAAGERVMGYSSFGSVASDRPSLDYRRCHGRASRFNRCEFQRRHVRAPARAISALTACVLSSAAIAVRPRRASATLPESLYPDESMTIFVNSKRIGTLAVFL